MKFIWILAAALAAFAFVTAVIANMTGLAVFDAALLVFDLFMLRLTLRRKVTRW